MAQGPVIRFTQTARQIGMAARAAGLVVPAFRTPPRLDGVDRTIRRLPGGPVVSVRVVGRPHDAVVADLVEGVVVANGLCGDAALRIRDALAAAAATPGHPIAA